MDRIVVIRRNDHRHRRRFHGEGVIMARLDRTPRARGQKQHRGFTMLETLITLAIITIWLLGSANVQTFALRLNKAAQFRTQAVLLASEMAERIEANKDYALTGGYAYSGGAATSTTRLAATLPSGTATITPDTSNPIIVTYTIVVNWTDRRTEQTYGSTGAGSTAGVEASSYTATRTLFNDTN
ncbi:MAG: type IV pilus modification protein PilV [Betaproteobacteria bacterium]|nr:MAG: type IV pilus modification protein PilV [Betaproteobacteria bacterium]